MVNLSNGPSRLIFPHASRSLAAQARPLPYNPELAAKALQAEAALGYTVPSGRYWEEVGRFDPVALDRLDALWLEAAALPMRQSA